ncbi:MAG: ABC transporter permease subunit [Eubacteriales bacterium]
MVGTRVSILGGAVGLAYAISMGLSCVARKRIWNIEYLFTKPVERKTIVLAKVIVSAVNLLVFALFSGVCDFSIVLPLGVWTAGSCCNVGMFFTQLLFFALGLLFASLFKSYKAAVRAGTVFVLAAYVLAFTAEYTGNRFLDYLTPLRYYDVYEVALNGVYLSYIVLTVLIVGACVMVSTRRWKLHEL